MSVLVSVVNTFANNSSPATIGEIVSGLLLAGAVPAEEVGEAILAGLEGDLEPAPGPMSLPDSPVAQRALTSTIYDVFSNSTYRRRSMSRLATLTGLTEEAVRSLVSANGDFRIREGSESGTEYVSIRGIR
jgi:hypothetical protein